jgi:hypothetical protein
VNLKEGLKMESNKQKVKKKHNWMKGFTIPKRKDPLELAQLETRSKIINDFKKIKRR